jgi:hypothetical protein
MTNAEKIQIVMNTIETLTVPASYENANRLTGIYQTLAEVRDDLSKPAEEGGEKHV